MRVYFTHSLLRVVDGTDDTLHISGRLRGEISPADEESLKEFPAIVILQFNTFATTESEMLDYASNPTIYMPDEFVFHLDVESLGRLAREYLISMLPLYAETWETKYQEFAEIRIGGQGEVLSRDERTALKQRMREVWTLPVRGRTFVVDRASLRDEFKRSGTDEAIRLAGGLVSHEVKNCDYYVTDRREAADGALQQGAKRVVDTLTLTLMIGPKE